MSKAGTSRSTTTQKGRRTPSPTPTQSLKLYRKSYKGGGANDLHFAVFRQAQHFTRAKRVLYPGCHRHLTASLIFPDVTYVDSDPKVAPLYSNNDSNNDNNNNNANDEVRDYVTSNKIYHEDAKYQCHCCNVHDETKLKKMLQQQQQQQGEEDRKALPQFDMLISLSAGILAEACTKFVSSAIDAGYLLVNDSHSDARTVFVNSDKNGWRLVAYWDDEKQDFVTEHLDRCFQVVVVTSSSSSSSLGNSSSSRKKTTVPITAQQVQESVAIGSIRKRSFKLLLEPHFFLFCRR